MKRRYVIALSCLLPCLAHAQTPSATDALLNEIAKAEQDTPPEVRDALNEQQKVFARHQVRGDGKTNPEAIPFGVAVESLFLHWAAFDVPQPNSFHDKLRTAFRGEEVDLNGIMQIAAGANAIAEKVRNQEAREMDAACQKLVAAEPWNAINALEVATEFKAIENKRMDLIEEHYRAALNGLSVTARTSLIAYIDAEIRPQMQWSTTDIIGVATEIPQDWLYNKRRSCESWLARPLSDRMWRAHPIERISLLQPLRTNHNGIGPSPANLPQRVLCFEGDAQPGREAPRYKSMSHS